MASRKQRPSPRWREHAARASTPDERLTVAADRLRAGLKHLRRPQRDPGMRLREAHRADRMADEAAGYLTRLCEQIESGDAA